MQPIYMPFTHISETVAEFINDVLGPVQLYQPGGLPIPSTLNHLVQQGMIQIRIPIEETDGDVLYALKQDYQRWADLHRDQSKIESGTFIAAPDTVPFFDKNSSAQIQTELNRLRKGEPPNAEKEALLSARLFLALAQEHDAHKVDLIDELAAVEAMEKRLMKNLKADDEVRENPLNAGIKKKEDAGIYMTQKRIESWGTLFLADAAPADIFVTDSRAVVEQLCDTSEDLIFIRDLNLPNRAESKSHENEKRSYFKELEKNLQGLARSTDPQAFTEKWCQEPNNTTRPHSKQPKCSVYIAPGISPASFWRRYGDSAACKKNHAGKESDILNTLLFHIEWQTF